MSGFFDFSGYIGTRNPGADVHSLHKVESALRQDLVSQSNSVLRRLSYRVGCIVDPKRECPPSDREREEIARIHPRVKGITLEAPQKQMTEINFAEYLQQIHELDRRELIERCVPLAGEIASMNKIQPLFVARVDNTSEKTGRLAPLKGLAIDTSMENSYHDALYNVVPVIAQTDGSLALLRGAQPELYSTGECGGYFAQAR